MHAKLLESPALVLSYAARKFARPPKEDPMAEPVTIPMLVEEAQMLEAAGAVALDFTNSGPVAGTAVVKAVKIPVIGGFGGGPWLDGRVRMAHTAIGYAARWIDSKSDTYYNGAKATLAAFTALIDDARSGRQIKG